MRVGRRGLIGAVAGAGIALRSGARAEAASLPTPSLIPSTGTYLVLLGTCGGPVPFTGRHGISSALVVDGRVYVIDLGHGAVDQFTAAGLDPANLRGIFVTHLHSDHIADLFTLPWLRFGGPTPLTHRVQVWGPGRAGVLPVPRKGTDRTVVNPSDPAPGIIQFMERSLAAGAYDINVRMRDEGWPDIHERLSVHEIPLPKKVKAHAHGPVAPRMKPFAVMDDGHVKVSAILVQHPPVFPSYAFRFDTPHGSVVFSGDTTVTPNIPVLAKGADVLVHEVIDLALIAAGQSAGVVGGGETAHLSSAHTDVTKVGAVAQASGVPHLVLSHLSPGTIAVPDALWAAQAQRGYTGLVTVGDDLAVIPVGV